MRLIKDQHEVWRKEINQRVWTRARRTRTDVPGVILNARAEAHLLHHFEIVFRPHLDALRFQQPARLLELRDARPQLFADREDGALHLVRRRHELLARKDCHRIELLQLVAGQRIEARQPVNLLAEELDAQRVFAIRRADFHRVAAHPEIAAHELDVVPVVLQVDEAQEKLLARQVHAHGEMDHHRLVILHAHDAVDARHTRHHQHVAPREERVHRREPHPLDGLVHAGILLDEGVRARDVSLRLIVIEVADEIFDRVVREEPLELRVELRRQRLVVRDDERRPVHVRDGVGHREGLARTCHAQQRLMFRAREQTFGQLRDGRRLISGGSKWRFKLEHALAN